MSNETGAGTDMLLKLPVRKSSVIDVLLDYVLMLASQLMSVKEKLPRTKRQAEEAEQLLDQAMVKIEFHFSRGVPVALRNTASELSAKVHYEKLEMLCLTHTLENLLKIFQELIIPSDQVARVVERLRRIKKNVSSGDVAFLGMEMFFPESLFEAIAAQPENPILDLLNQGELITCPKIVVLLRNADVAQLRQFAQEPIVNNALALAALAFSGDSDLNQKLKKALGLE